MAHSEPNSFRLFDFQVGDDVLKSQSGSGGSSTSSSDGNGYTKKFSKDKK